jgi:hypothetical protein
MTRLGFPINANDLPGVEPAFRRVRNGPNLYTAAHQAQWEEDAYDCQSDYDNDPMNLRARTDPKELTKLLVEENVGRPHC